MPKTKIERVSAHELFSDFDSLDLDGAYEEVSKEVTKILTIYTFLTDKFCDSNITNKTLIKFLDSEAKLYSDKFDKLASIRTSIKKLLYWED